jgi:nitric oxide dioxygenase
MVGSFYLTPKDGGKVPKSWKPGQYVGIRQYVDEVGMEVTRTYSISNYPGSDSIRLTVKKEQNGTKEGLVSSTLHGMKEGDTLNITMPCGDFVLSPPATETVPIVLLGLGIGVTPIYPLAKQVASTYANPIHVILGARNEDSQALVADFEELKKSHPDKIDLKVCIKSPNKGSPAQTMNFPYIWSQVPHDGDYYFCGPHGWMDELNHGFLASSVSPSNIHFEFFGPTLQLQQ